MRSVLETALPLSEVLWQRALTVQETDTPEGRAGLNAALIREANAIADPTVRDHYRSFIQTRMREAFPWGGGRRAGQHDGYRGRARDRVSGPAARRPARGEFRTLTLLAILINHPALFEEVAEWFVTVDVHDDGLATTRREVVARLTDEPGIEAAALYAGLCESGHQGNLDRLLTDRLFTVEPRARRSASLDQARSAWIEISRRVEQERLQEELRQAGRALGADPTEVNSDRVLALQAELSGAESDDPDAF